MHESFLRILRVGCPFGNAADRDAVGTCCHLAKREWILRSRENSVLFLSPQTFTSDFYCMRLYNVAHESALRLSKTNLWPYLLRQQKHWHNLFGCGVCFTFGQIAANKECICDCEGIVHFLTINLRVSKKEPECLHSTRSAATYDTICPLYSISLLVRWSEEGREKHKPLEAFRLMQREIWPETRRHCMWGFPAWIEGQFSVYPTAPVKIEFMTQRLR